MQPPAGADLLRAAAIEERRYRQATGLPERPASAALSRILKVGWRRTIILDDLSGEIARRRWDGSRLLRLTP